MRPNWFSSALERRNFSMLTLDGVLFFTASTFLDATILIPLFLQHVGGSVLLIGLAATIRQIGFVLPQLLTARYLSKIPRLNRFVFWSYLICRFAFLLVIAALLRDPHSPFVIVAFFIGYTMFTLGEGITQVPWMDVFSRTIRPHNHGTSFGLMQTCGAVGAFLGGLLIQEILAHPDRYPYPTNFLLLFAVAFGCLLVATLCFLYVKEGPRQTPPNAEGEPASKRKTTRFSRIWRTQPAFRRLLIVQTLVGVHQLVMPFYILYAQTLPGVDAVLIGQLVIAQILGGAAGGILFGWISSRLGNRMAVCSNVLFNLVVPVLILVAGQLSAGATVRPLVTVAFFLLGLVGGGWIGFTNYLLDISNDETRGTYIAYLNTCSAPLALLPIFSGSLVGAMSYAAVFVIVLILLLVASYVALRLPPTTTRYRRGDRAARLDRKTNAAPQ
ncbi:MAG TPA: MFS transporter [Bacilli bacterium]|nr:MFS transporter [Bacilli bacterium]